MRATAEWTRRWQVSADFAASIHATHGLRLLDVKLPQIAGVSCRIAADEAAN